MEPAEFQHWTTRFGTSDVTTEPLMLDYISAIFITYKLSLIPGDLLYINNFEIV